MFKLFLKTKLYHQIKISFDSFLHETSLGKVHESTQSKTLLLASNYVKDHRNVRTASHTNWFVYFILFLNLVI